MLNNPEFTKNVKIEFGALRFAVPLVVLFLVVWLGWNSNSAGSWKSQIYKPEQLKAAALFAWLCGFGYLFSIIWGTYLTTNNVLEEIKLKTWDFVRLSSLSPFKILTGKMFGATSVVWVVTALCVMPLIYFTGHLMIPADGVIRPEGITLLILLATIFSWVIISYSLVFILLMSASDPKDRAGMFGVTGAIALLGTALGLSITESFEDFHKIFRYGYEVNEKIIEAPFG